MTDEPYSLVKVGIVVQFGVRVSVLPSAESDALTERGSVDTVGLVRSTPVAESELKLKTSGQVECSTTAVLKVIVSVPVETGFFAKFEMFVTYRPWFALGTSGTRGMIRSTGLPAKPMLTLKDCCPSCTPPTTTGNTVAL